VKRILIPALGVIGAVVGVVLIRTLLASSAAIAEPEPSSISVDGSRIARHLSEAIRLQTVSHQTGTMSDPAPFADFIAWVERTYPEVGEKLEREVVNDYSLLFTWPGADPTRKPILLTGHYDVVPVIPGTEELWEQPPFSGAIADGFVWGRGALDDKGAVITMLEATTHLLGMGFVPQRTIYLALGHDEEIGGQLGAGGITKLLQERGVQLEWSLDEGSFVIAGMLPGVDHPIASINVAEKGYVTLELVASGTGGHSSIPPRQTAVGTLAAAIVAVEASPLPGGSNAAMDAMMDALVPHVPFAVRIVLANRWLFGGLLDYGLGRVPSMNAMIRTTTAATMLEGSIKENVLPIEAVGAVNFRLHPRDTPEFVEDHIRRVIDDERVEVRRRGTASRASAVSSSESDGFRLIAEATARVYGKVIVVPGMTVGGTDSRHYGQIADDAYRFNPMVVTADDIAGFHGTNERISIENLVNATRTYAEIMLAVAGR
jgi:carboxypeptidase PM20D1